MIAKPFNDHFKFATDLTTNYKYSIYWFPWKGLYRFLYKLYKVMWFAMQLSKKIKRG